MAHAWELILIVYFVVAVALGYGLFRLVQWLRR
jgi:hypothetical protein